MQRSGASNPIGNLAKNRLAIVILVAFSALFLFPIRATMATSLFSFSPPAVDFGEVAVGSSAAQAVTVTNAGSGEITINQVSLWGGGSTEYAIVNDGLSGQTLQPGASRQIDIKFIPKTLAGSGVPDFHYEGGYWAADYNYNNNGTLTDIKEFKGEGLFNHGGSGSITWKVSVGSWVQAFTDDVLAGQYYRPEITYFGLRRRSQYDRRELPVTIDIPSEATYLLSLADYTVDSFSADLVRAPAAQISIHTLVLDEWQQPIIETVDLFGVGAGNGMPATTLSAPTYSTNQSATSRFKVRWSADSADSYAVQYKIGLGGTWKTWKSATTATSAYFDGRPGKTYYFRARAKKGGKTGAWSAEKSTVVPYNQSAAVYKGRWGSASLAKMYKASTRFSAKKNASAAYAFSNARSLSLIVTKRPRGGKADVYIDDVKIKTIDFYAPAVRYRRAVAVKGFTAPTSGELKVVVNHAKNSSSAGYRVELDGVGVKR